MPYGYYKLLRFIAMIVFGINAYKYGAEKNSLLMIVMGALTILLQPLFPLTLGRLIWNIVEVIVAIFLLFLWYNVAGIRKKI